MNYFWIWSWAYNSWHQTKREILIAFNFTLFWRSCYHVCMCLTTTGGSGYLVDPCAFLSGKGISVPMYIIPVRSSPCKDIPYPSRTNLCISPKDFTPIGRKQKQVDCKQILDKNTFLRFRMGTASCFFIWDHSTGGGVVSQTGRSARGPCLPRSEGALFLGCVMPSSVCPPGEWCHTLWGGVIHPSYNTKSSDLSVVKTLPFKQILFAGGKTFQVEELLWKRHYPSP